MSHHRRSMVKDWPKHLNDFRATHNLTQKQLADKLMIAASVVEQWSCGRFTPPPYLKLALMEVARRLQKSLDQSEEE